MGKLCEWHERREKNKTCYDRTISMHVQNIYVSLPLFRSLFLSVSLTLSLCLTLTHSLPLSFSPSLCADILSPSPPPLSDLTAFGLQIGALLAERVQRLTRLGQLVSVCVWCVRAGQKHWHIDRFFGE